MDTKIRLQPVIIPSSSSSSSTSPAILTSSASLTSYFEQISTLYEHSVTSPHYQSPSEQLRRLSQSEFDQSQVTRLSEPSEHYPDNHLCGSHHQPDASFHGDHSQTSLQQTKMEERRDDLSDDDEVSTKASPLLTFEDDQLKSTALLTLNTLRRGGHFCDVTFQVGNHSLNAHRAVLACSSMYLYELFSEDEAIKQTIKLKVLDYHSFVALVDYAYTARLEITEMMINSVYHTARLLNMDRAADACATFMVDHLTPANCLGTRSIANSYSDQTLTKKTDNYIRSNLDNVLSSNQIHKFPRLQVQIMGITEVQEGEEEHLCQLAVDFFQKTMDQEETDDLDMLAEYVRVLYLHSGSHLVDCLDIDDSTINQSDLVTDYKKLNKHKQPGKDKTLMHSLSNGSLNVDHSPSLGEPEWTVVSTKLHSETRCTCIAVLGNTLVMMTLKFHPHPQSSPTPEEQVSAQSSARSSPTPVWDKPGQHLTPLSRMSSARCGVGTAILHDNLIALGGYDRGECLNTVESYDLDNNKWTSLPSMLTPRGRFDVTQIQGKLFACGGSNGSQELKSVECYDPSSEKWHSLADMSTCRSSAGVAVLRDALYIVGGWSGCSGLKSCEKYDLETEKWTDIAPLNTGRSQSAICEYHNKLVVVGGCDAWNCTNTVEMYDPNIDKWMFLTPMTTCRRGAGVATFKDKLYVVGGSDGQQSLASVEIYDVVKAAWFHGPPLSTPRANVAVAVIRDILFAVGGFSGKVFLDSIEYISSHEDEWSSYVYQTSPSGRGDYCFGINLQDNGAEEDENPIPNGYGTHDNRQNGGNGIPENTSQNCGNGTIQIMQNGCKA